MKRPVIILLIFMLGAVKVQADSNGREIMVKADNVDNSRDAMMSSIMVIERGKDKLIRRMEHMTKQYGDHLQDERTLIRFSEPADVRDTAYLTWSYNDPGREDDMWVYLPAEKLVRRISGGGKKGAFMRSDLANEDIEDRAVDDDEHTLKGEEKISGVSCYVIESVPRPELKKDTNYSKRHQYIRTDIFLPARIEFFDKRGKLLKTATYGGYEQIGGIWTTTRVVFETPRRKTRTLMQRTNIIYNQGLDDSLFQQNRLQR